LVPPPPTSSSAAAPTLATRGNYQGLRDFFFAFRKLIHAKTIRADALTKEDVALINGHIRSNPHWDMQHAQELYLLLGRWAKDMRTWGHDYKTLMAPMQYVAVATPRPQAAAAVRQQSITQGDGCLLLYLHYDNPLHAYVKAQFTGRTWDRELRSWRVPYEHSAALLAFAKTHGLAVGDSAGRAMQNYLNNLSLSYAKERIELALPLKMELFDYQTVGADFGIRMRRWLCADEMGLGKTSQAIAAAVGWNRWPILVICPKSLRANWKLEIEQWTHYKALVATPKTMRHLPELVQRRQCDFLIVNYDGLRTHFVNDILPGIPGKDAPTVVFNGRERLFKGVIIDEAHELKNPTTERTQVVKALVRNLEYRTLLTGTPFVNQISDMASLVELCGHMGAFGGRENFMKEFGRVKAKDFAAGKGGVELRRLNNRLREVCMVRREKHQVLTQLPDKFRTVVPIELDNRRDYDLAFTNLHRYLSENNASPAAKSAEALVQLGLLKQLSCRGKVKQAVEYVNNILSQGQKFILFVWHKETIRELKKYWPHLLEISGNVTDDQIQVNKALFQSSPHHNLIVITYKKGGVGHTLTAASNVGFLELGWNPKDQNQAEDRAHRIGQKFSVTCHYFLGVDTVDQWIYDLIIKKDYLAQESVGDTKVIEVSVQQALTRRVQAYQMAA
jgi:SWI/SNF-related matrix-associated actin-dependent regulator 1 of chromatin subfamily A